MSRKLKVAGRICFGLALIGLGVQQFVYPGFQPFFVPFWPPEWPGQQALVYLLNIVLIFAGVSIIFDLRARIINLYIGVLFLCMFAFLHIPFQVQNNPGALGAWTNAFKILAFSGSAFIVARSFDVSRVEGSIEALVKLARFGRIFFGLMLLVFGIDHFLYASGVATLVPNWIPFSLFWTYLAGVALIGAGVSIIIRFQLRLVSMLTGIMIFIWFLVLHIPRAVAMPQVLNGNEVTSVMQSLAFSGVSFVFAFSDER
jgi:uncharacterized membrane protein